MNLRGSIELLASKIGPVLVVLGIMHFFNIYVFSRFRRRAMERNLPPPRYAQSAGPAGVCEE